MNDVWGRVRPLVFRTIIGAVVAAGLVAVFAVLVGDFGTVAIQLLLTILVVVVFALLSWYDADVSSQRSGAFALASVATSLYLLIVGFVKIWIVHPDQPDARTWTVGNQFAQWLGLATVARAALLHVHLLLVIHRRFPAPVLQVVSSVTVGVIALLAVLVSLPILFPHTHFADGYWRVLWVVAILDLLGTVVVPLSNALFGPGGGERPMPVGSTGPLSEETMAPTSMSMPPMPIVMGPVAMGPVATGPASAPSFPAAPGWSAAPFADGAPQPQPHPHPHPAPGRGTPLVYEPAPRPLRVLAWPRYVDGSPLPALSDGTPDFSGVERR